MKALLPFLVLAFPATLCLASFTITDLVEWEQVESRGLELRFERIKPSSTIERNVPYYRFRLVAPTSPGGRDDVDLRIDFWKDNRSTEIPIQLSDGGPGIKQAFFSISEDDLETSVIVVRYGSRNTSSEFGYRLNLKNLIEKKKGG